MNQVTPKKPTSFSFSLLVAICLGALWMLWLGLDYFDKYPLFAKALQESAFYLPILFFAVAGGIAVKLLVATGQSFRFLNGASLFVGSMLLYTIILYVAKSSLDRRFSVDDVSVGMWISMVLVYSIGPFLLFLFSYGAGEILLTALGYKGENYTRKIIAIAIGLFCFYFYSFLLAGFGILYWYTAVIAFVVVGFLSFRQMAELLRQLFIHPISLKGLRWYGGVSFVILVCMLWMTIPQSVTIFPKGYDAQTLYALLPKVIGEEHQLIEGYRPYAWSVIQSLGYIFFDAMEISNLLSGIMGLLVISATYVLSTEQLKLRRSEALLVCAFVVGLPAFTTQLSHELKIDLALLFVQLATLLLLLEKRVALLKDVKLAILLGLLLGFSMSIKVSALLFIVAAISISWHSKKNWTLAAAIFLATLGLFYLARIDTFTGLDLGFEARWLYGGISLLVAIGLIVKAGLSQSEAISRRIRMTLWIGLFMGLSFSPWVIKNAIECGQWSVSCFINGVSQETELNMQEVDRNYQEYKKNKQ